jgi:hypothetical protein
MKTTTTTTTATTTTRAVLPLHQQKRTPTKCRGHTTTTTTAIDERRPLRGEERPAVVHARSPPRGQASDLIIVLISSRLWIEMFHLLLCACVLVSLLLLLRGCGLPWAGQTVRHNRMRPAGARQSAGWLASCTTVSTGKGTRNAAPRRAHTNPNLPAIIGRRRHQYHHWWGRADVSGHRFVFPVNWIDAISGFAMGASRVPARRQEDTTATRTHLLY